jgi:endo-1,4-beta-xylanase
LEKSPIERKISMHTMNFIPSQVQRAILAGLMAAGCFALTANGQTVSGNGTGTNSGYYYSLYSSGGSASMTFPQASTYPGNYAMTWSGVSDVVGGKGWSTGGNMTVGYNIGSASGYNTISIYGWTTSPLVEYYITELGSLYTADATYKGSVTSDGHTYSTYEHEQVNQPSIEGTATFEQYLDAWGGSSIGSNHTVTTGNHFSHWESLGMPLGSFNYMILGTEAYNGASGEVNATVW